MNIFVLEARSYLQLVNNGTSYRAIQSRGVSNKNKLLKQSCPPHAQVYNCPYSILDNRPNIVAEREQCINQLSDHCFCLHKLPQKLINIFPLHHSWHLIKISFKNIRSKASRIFLRYETRYVLYGSKTVKYVYNITSTVVNAVQLF